MKLKLIPIFQSRKYVASHLYNKIHSPESSENSVNIVAGISRSSFPKPLVHSIYITVRWSVPINIIDILKTIKYKNALFAVNSTSFKFYIAN